MSTRRLVRTLSGSFLAFLVALIASASAEVMEMKRPEEVTRIDITEVKELNTERYKKWKTTPIRDMPSRRKLITSRREKLADDVDLFGASPGTDTIRIALLRVEFESVPDPAKITGGTGRFMLEDERGTVFIDPPPHDRNYFSKHLEALAYYYDGMSYGRLVIESEVFPLADDGAYVLPDVGNYNTGGETYTWTWEELEAFFTDAVMAADQDPDLDFADFDAVVIAHAGSDWQNDIYGDSPYDIPSFFISLAGSITVDDSLYIVDGSVVPETGSQDGFYNGINGVLAHEVGHQLGLPDLYDTFIGGSVIGYWDLMDFGSGVGIVLQDPVTEDAFYVTGIVPGPLSVWSRTFLGWLEPDTVYAGGRFELEAIDVQGTSPGKEGLIVPIHSYEYYMIENRQCDLDGDGVGYLLRDPSEDSTGVIIGPVDWDSNRNYEFAFALPGCGLLIFRVDQVMVDYGNPWDIVNAYPERRGVRIMEADGTWDLGDYNSFYFLGSYYDPFFSGGGGNNRFADDTYPRSVSNTGCSAHIEVNDISESRMVMDFEVSIPWTKKRFPIALSDSLRYGVTSVLVFDVDGDGSDEIGAFSKRAEWVDTLGTVFEPADIYLCEFDGDSGPRVVPGWPRRIHGTEASEILAADLDGDGIYEIIAGDDTDRLYAFEIDGTPYFSNSDTNGAFRVLEGGLNGAPVAYDIVDGVGGEEILVGTGDGLMALSGASRSGAEIVDVILRDGGSSQPAVGDFLPRLAGDEIVVYREGAIEVIHPLLEEMLVFFPVSTDLAPGDVVVALADLDRAPGDAFEVILAGMNGTIWVLNYLGDQLPGWGRRITEGFAGPPAIADVDGDGYLDIVISDLEYKTYVLDHGGARLRGWPQYGHGCGLPAWDAGFYPADTTVPVAPAVLIDIDGDPGIEVVQGSRFECVIAWDDDGERAPGYPYTFGGASASMAFGDIDGDGKGEFVAGGGEGFLYAFTGAYDQPTVSASPWRASYGGRARNCVYPPELMPEQPVPGTELLVTHSFHAFPNPADHDAVTFSFDTETGGTAMVEIYDITGLRVKSTPRFAAVSRTEYTVDISDLASGVYVCRLYVEGDGGESTETFKLAVRR